MVETFETYSPTGVCCDGVLKCVVVVQCLVRIFSIIFQNQEQLDFGAKREFDNL